MTFERKTFYDLIVARNRLAKPRNANLAPSKTNVYETVGNQRVELYSLKFVLIVSKIILVS